MSKLERWIAYDREITQNSDGIIEKIVFKERNGSVRGITSNVDLILKSVGIVAIFIPLFSIYLQNRNSARDNRSKALSDIFISFTKADSKVNSKLNKEEDFQSAEIMLDSIRTEYKSTVLLYGNAEMSTAFNKLMDIKNIKVNLLKLNTYGILCESIFNKIKKLSAHIEIYDPKMISKEALKIKTEIDLNDQHLKSITKDSLINGLSFLNKIHYELELAFNNLIGQQPTEAEYLLKAKERCQNYCFQLSQLTTQYSIVDTSPSETSRIFLSYLPTIESTIKDREFIRDTIIDKINDMETSQHRDFERRLFLQLGN